MQAYYYKDCILIGCKINLDNEKLQKINAEGKYPLIVDVAGDIIYPVGEKKLFFGKMLGVYLSKSWH